MIKAHGLRLDHEKKRFEERKKAVMKDGLDGVPDDVSSCFCLFTLHVATGLQVGVSIRAHPSRHRCVYPRDRQTFQAQ
jgi:hypothetical protein